MAGYGLFQRTSPAKIPILYAACVKQVVSFRTAHESDIDEIVALWQMVNLAHGDEAADAAIDRGEITERLQRDRELFIVGEREGRLVASVMGCYDGHRGWVKRFAVHPDVQGHKVGRRMNDELERRFLAAGIDQLRLSVWRSNEGALGFWQAMGFEEIDVAYHTKSLGPE